MKFTLNTCTLIVFVLNCSKLLMQKKVPGCYIMPSALSPLSKFNVQSNGFAESWQ
jgi:hypothetical protein